jgi:hypothetical protein
MMPQAPSTQNPDQGKGLSNLFRQEVAGVASVAGWQKLLMTELPTEAYAASRQSAHRDLASVGWALAVEMVVDCLGGSQI